MYQVHGDGATGGIKAQGQRMLNVLSVDTVAKALRLCYLQIAQTFPITLNLALYAVNTGITGSVTNVQSVADIQKSYFSYRALYASYAADCFAHSFHLFMYLAFSAMFRDVFRKTYFGK